MSEQERDALKRSVEPTKEGGAEEIERKRDFTELSDEEKVLAMLASSIEAWKLRLTKDKNAQKVYVTKDTACKLVDLDYESLPVEVKVAVDTIFSEKCESKTEEDGKVTYSLLEEEASLVAQSVNMASVHGYIGMKLYLVHYGKSS